MLKSTDRFTVEYVIKKYLESVHCYQLAGLVENNSRLLCEIMAIGGFKEINKGFSEFIDENGLVDVIRMVLKEVPKSHDD
ncbi:hypothetical protein [Lactobacillus sp.]|uniref:hypothetical protein n=1 Tax=Lactobacillus sp. TaxID=1591 RepID=UPI001984F5A1|nr:hypothetical protein [Lactobacillus sp.]MBD5430127.1 hypothetical protein [Lactobacillus sp.]